MELKAKTSSKRCPTSQIFLRETKMDSSKTGRAVYFRRYYLTRKALRNAQETEPLPEGWHDCTPGRPGRPTRSTAVDIKVHQFDEPFDPFARDFPTCGTSCPEQTASS